MENIPENVGSNSRRLSDVGFKRLSGTRLEDIFKSPALDKVRKKNFLLQKKRKRHRTDEDNISLQSVDSIQSINSIQSVQSVAVTSDHPKRKRRSLSKITSSLVNILSPVRPVKKVGKSLQKSLSLRSLLSPKREEKPHVGTPYKRPTPSGGNSSRRRESTFWYQTVDQFDMNKYDQQQVKRQEAIYELFKGEEDVIEDLAMVKITYHDSMKKLGLLSDEELEQIFGHIDSLTPVHQALMEGLRDQRLPDGTTEFVGEVILHWVPNLETYIDYCANQVFAKALLDFKKQDPSVEDFLQRCQDSPFSRKLDLWSFLDVPRSKLVKYPLLLKSIQKYTHKDHSDIETIDRAITKIEEIIKQVDYKTGISKCKYTKEKLDFLDEKQRSPLVEQSESILCDGILKNNRGTKLYVFLFEKVLVLTRPASRGGKLKYQVYRTPIPASQLVLNDEGEGKSGSFRSAFAQGQPAGKLAFKVSFKDPVNGQSHTLIANDEHDKKQWIQAIKSILPSDDQHLTGGTANGGFDDTADSGAPNPGKRESGDGQSQGVNPSKRRRSQARDATRFLSNVSDISTISGISEFSINESVVSEIDPKTVNSMLHTDCEDDSVCIETKEIANDEVDTKTANDSATKVNDSPAKVNLDNVVGVSLSSDEECNSVSSSSERGSGDGQEG